MGQQKIELPENGIYAYYRNGSFRTYDNADSSAIGVAVITDEAKFVMDKIDSPRVLDFGGYYTDMSKVGIICTSNLNQAKQDFNGDSNTTKIINLIGAEATAANYCRTRFNGKGYLPALGEWTVALDNKNAINSMIEKIVGSYLSTTDYYLSSTLYNAKPYLWAFAWEIMGWNSSNYDASGRDYAHTVRAFMSLIK